MSDLLFISAATVGMLIAWFWLVAGMRRTGLRFALGFMTLHVSLGSSLLVLFQGDAQAAAISFFWPVLTPILMSDSGRDFGEFFGHFLPITVVLGVMVSLIVARMPELRTWSLVIGIFVFLILTAVSGEFVSRQQMCLAARNNGVSEIRRHSFLWSALNRGKEFQFEIHAIFVKEGKRFGWSYSEVAFYEIPSSVSGEVSNAIFVCR